MYVHLSYLFLFLIFIFFSNFQHWFLHDYLSHCLLYHLKANFSYIRFSYSYEIKSFQNFHRFYFLLEVHPIFLWTYNKQYCFVGKHLFPYCGRIQLFKNNISFMFPLWNVFFFLNSSSSQIEKSFFVWVPLVNFLKDEKMVPCEGATQQEPESRSHGSYCLLLKHLFLLPSVWFYLVHSHDCINYAYIQPLWVPLPS